MSEIQLDLDKMRESKFMIATPMYGGMCHGLYTRSLMETCGTLQQYGVGSQIYYIFNESLITRARNYCVANFLKSDSDYLIFIDSDIGWRSMDFMYMLHLITTDPDKYRIMCGLYPKKTIAWEKIIQAAKSGKYDNAPWELEQVGGDMAFNPDPDEYPDGRAPIFQPMKVKEGATGFMIIQRSVFEEYAEAHPELLYTPDHVREGEFAPGEKITAFFDCIINEDNRYLSEDYMFSEYCRNLGIDIWALPMIELMHCGSHIYRGNLIKMAESEVHATISPDEVANMQNKASDLRHDKNSS